MLLCAKGKILLKNDKTDFTQGRILPKLAFFMLPILGALVLQAAYGAVDLLVVGRFGSTSGLSAVSTGSQVLNLVTFVVTQLAHCPLSGRKTTAVHRASHWRGSCCVHPSGSCTVRGAGVFCTAYFQSDAGSCRSPGPDRQLCAHLRQRHLLYCSL